LSAELRRKGRSASLPLRPCTASGNPAGGRATLEATLAIEHSIAVGNLVMLPLAAALH